MFVDATKNKIKHFIRRLQNLEKFIVLTFPMCSHLRMNCSSLKTDFSPKLEVTQSFDSITSVILKTSSVYQFQLIPHDVYEVLTKRKTVCSTESYSTRF